MKPILPISRLHQSHLEQLTGCRYAVLLALAQALGPQLAVRRGRPYQHGPLAMAVLTFLKLRWNVSYRALEALTGVDAVTLSRYVQKVTAALNRLPLRARAAGCLLVDTTSVRVACTSLAAYSGHKHQRCAKVQLVCDEAGAIVHVGRAWPGSVHDKTVYERERVTLARTLRAPMLADKAYAGVHDDGAGLMRPIKRNEKAWATHARRAYNRELNRRRVGVEHVFARLKTFRVLQGIFPFRWPSLGQIVRALSVVHNAHRCLAGINS